MSVSFSIFYAFCFVFCSVLACNIDLYHSALLESICLCIQKIRKEVFRIHSFELKLMKRKTKLMQWFGYWRRKDNFARRVKASSAIKARDERGHFYLCDSNFLAEDDRLSFLSAKWVPFPRAGQSCPLNQPNFFSPFCFFLLLFHLERSWVGAAVTW